MNQTTNTLFATDVVVSVDNTTFGKLILVAVIIFGVFFLMKKTIV